MNMLGEELSNSATYFSFFADVDKNSVGEFNGTFGRESRDTWKPWVYRHRIEVVKAVKKFKEKVEKNVREHKKIEYHLINCYAKEPTGIRPTDH